MPILAGKIPSALFWLNRLWRANSNSNSKAIACQRHRLKSVDELHSSTKAAELHSSTRVAELKLLVKDRQFQFQNDCLPMSPIEIGV
jgi:Ran GTPase-activating protein (RanGAP) involved in mRNA processing and transport